VNTHPARLAVGDMPSHQLGAPRQTSGRQHPFQTETVRVKDGRLDRPANDDDGRSSIGLDQFDDQ
jgi:hypothetical protein